MRVQTNNWGQSLVLTVFSTPGGLNPAVDKLRTMMGSSIGTRNTFAKLQRVERIEDLNDKDQWRAWLLLTVLGENPSDWGLYNDVIPAAYDSDTLTERLRGASKTLTKD